MVKKTPQCEIEIPSESNGEILDEFGQGDEFPEEGESSDENIDSGPDEDEDEEDIESCQPAEGSCEGARFEVVREKVDNKWHYYWMLYAGNGKQIATSPGPFRRINDAKKAMRTVGIVATTAPTVRLY